MIAAHRLPDLSSERIRRSREKSFIDVHSPSTTFVLMSHEPEWVGWGRELQAIAQTGLHFSESEYEFVGENEIPPLSFTRNTREQIQFCFDARKNPGNPCRFD
jgi:Hydrolase of X-linked nucleoside diphosphate N terminal